MVFSSFWRPPSLLLVAREVIHDFYSSITWISITARIRGNTNNILYCVKFRFLHKLQLWSSYGWEDILLLWMYCNQRKKTVFIQAYCATFRNRFFCMYFYKSESNRFLEEEARGIQFPVESSELFPGWRKSLLKCSSTSMTPPIALSRLSVPR